MNKMCSILMVDDHHVVRVGIKDILLKTPDLRIEGEAENAKEAMEKISAQEWDLVLLDFNLPDEKGIDVLKRIKNKKPELPVLMFSSFSENEFALACVRAGASGYVTKDTSPEQIRSAIRQAAGGEKYVSSWLAEQLLNGAGMPHTDELHDRLTCREFEVLLGISRGHSLTDIGVRLNLSVKTISTHRANILRKMEMDNNADLTKYVQAKGLDAEGEGCRYKK